MRRRRRNWFALRVDVRQENRSSIVNSILRESHALTGFGRA